MILKAVLVGVVVASAPLTAQATGSIAGTVVDSAQAPVFSAIVTVSGTRLGGFTDSAGRFRIDGVSERRVEVRARLGGYGEVMDSVDVRGGQTVEITLRLARSAVQLSAVRSEGKGPERDAFETDPTVGSVTLSSRVITRLPRFGEADIMRVAQLLPGVQARNDYSAGLNVRGGEADQNLILMDGYPIFNPFHFGGLFGTFIDGAVGEIELLTGGFPARYGGRLSSVFDVRSAEETRRGLHGSSTVSLLATSASVGSALPGGRGSWSLSGRRTYADAMFKLFGKNTIPYHFRDAQAHGTYRLSPSTWITTTLYNGLDGISVAASEEDQPFTFWWGNTVAGATLTSTRNGMQLEQRVAWSTFGTGLDIDAGSLQLDNHIRELRLSGHVRWPGVGVRGAHDREVGYEVTHDGILYDATSQATDVAFFHRAQSPTALAAYYDDVWRAGAHTLVDGGVRVEHLAGSGWTGLSPRASVKRFLTDNVAITAAVGWYSQWLHSLAREDIPIRLFDFWASSDRNTPVSRATHYVLGSEAWLARDRFVRVEGYVKHYGSLVEPNPADDANVEGDEFIATTGQSYGVDVLLRQLESDRWGGWLTYSYGYNRRRTADEWHYPAQDRRHNANLVLTYRVSPKYSASLRFGYASGTPFTDIIGEFGRHAYNIRTGGWTSSDSAHLEPLGGVRNANRFPATQRLDLSVTYDRPGRITVSPFLSLINAYNAHNVFMYVFDYGAKPPTRKALSQLPLLPTLGVTVTF